MAEANRVFTVEIITPERVFYRGEADFIEFTTADGDIGVYKNHIPLTTVLAPGVVTIHNGEEEKKALLHAGFVEILGDRVNLLVEIAEWPDEIDVARAEAAKERATERLEGRAGESSVDVARAEYALKKALLRIGAADLK